MRSTFNDRVEAYFKAYPLRWIDSQELEKVGGRMAWRSRVSDVRRRGLRIDNRQRHIRTASGEQFTRSEYRYVPQPVTLLEQMEQPSA